MSAGKAAAAPMIGQQVGSILNGIQGSVGSGVSDSWGSSADYAYNYGIGNTAYDAFGESWGNNVSHAYNRVYGTEASNRDFQNAKDANLEARDMWTLQAHYNAEEAAKQRAYETEMSNTAYQRAVKDLLSAGLNPILAVGSGMQATTPMGMSASAGLASAHKANTFADQVGWSNSSGSSYGYNSATGRGNSYSEGGSQGSSNWGSNGENTQSNNIRDLGRSIGDLAKDAFDFGVKVLQDAWSQPSNGGSYGQDIWNIPQGGKQAITYNSTSNSAKTIGSTAKTAAAATKAKASASKKK